MQTNNITYHNNNSVISKSKSNKIFTASLSHNVCWLIYLTVNRKIFKVIHVLRLRSPTTGTFIIVSFHYKLFKRIQEICQTSILQQIWSLRDACGALKWSNRDTVKTENGSLLHLKSQDSKSSIDSAVTMHLLRATHCSMLVATI